MNQDRVADIFQRAMESNREAFADGEYDIADRALKLTLDCAQRLKNNEYLFKVERCASKQSRYLHDHRPEYCGARHGIDTFRLIARQAGTSMRAIEHEKKIVVCPRIPA